MTEDIKFEIENKSTEETQAADTPVEAANEPQQEKYTPDEIFERFSKLFSEREQAKADEKTAREQENERVANQHRLLDKAEEIGLSRDELDSRQNILSSILKKDKLDIFEETTALLDLEHKERALKLEREAQKAKTIEDDIIRKYGEHGKTYLMPKISEKIDEAANFPLIKELEKVLSSSQLEKLRTKLVQHHSIKSELVPEEVIEPKKSPEELWNVLARKK